MPLTQLSITANVSNEVSTTATKTSVALSATSVEILSSNANRQGLLIENTSGNDVYIGYSTLADVASASFTIPNNAIYEMPQPIYTGAIHGIAASGTPSINVTEFS
jgi:hypothetical protein